MRKFIFLSAAIMLLGFNAVFAQDTTALRFIAITSWDSGDILFFNNDTSDLYEVPSSIHDGGNNTTGHALFVNPNDGLLYGIADPHNFTARSLYRINPLTGQYDSIMVVGDHPASAEVTPDGKLYAIEGNGGATPGAINEIDLANLTQTQVAVSNVTGGQPRGMVYNPQDSCLYIYSSYIDSVFIMNTNTWTETKQYAYSYQEVHGGYYRDNQFWLASYYGQISHVNLVDSLGGVVTDTSNYTLMDLTEFRMLAGSQQRQLFPSSSIILRSLYESSAFQWYRNDTLISGANADSLVVTTPGTYKLLAEIDTSGNYIWSEEIQVTMPAITDLRFIGTGGWGDDILYFNNDTSDMMSVYSTADSSYYFTGHALFVNPNDDMLYAVADSSNNFGSTTRNIYKINPLTGQYDFVMPLNNWTTDIAVTPDGRFFSIDGNGSATPGAINEIDLVNLTQTPVAQSNVTKGEPRTMVYNPQDSSLYIYSADNGNPVDTVFIMKLDTWTETSSTCAVEGEIHGSYYRDNKIWLSSYYGEIVYVDLANGLDGTTIVTSNYNIMDITEFDLLNEDQSIGVCANVPVDVVLHTKYPSTAYIWYKDGMPIPGANSDSLVTNDYGDYKLLTEIDTSGSYIWSETINIHSLNVPNVSVFATDTLWCAGDTIQLTGSSGGTSQWYMNGVAIAGADTNAWYAINPGNYNMTKTNLNGCTDSAAVGITIVQDPGCPNKIDNPVDESNISIYPTPFSNVVNIASSDKIDKVIITDIKGAVVVEMNVNAGNASINAENFKPGIYFIKVVSADNVVIKQIIKQ